MKNPRLTATLAITLLPSLAFAQHHNGNLLLASQRDVNAASVYTGVTGNLNETFTWPSQVMPGDEVVFQWWIVDPAGPQGWSTTAGIEMQEP